MPTTLGTARFRIEAKPLDGNGMPLATDGVLLGVLSLDLPVDATKGEVAESAPKAIRDALSD